MSKAAYRKDILRSRNFTGLFAVSTYSPKRRRKLKHSVNLSIYKLPNGCFFTNTLSRGATIEV